MSPSPPSIGSSVDHLVVGAGYLGRELIRQCPGGQTVAATTRSATKLPRLAAAGATAVRFDWNDSRTYRNLPAAHHVIVAVSHDPGGGVDRMANMVGGFSRLLRHFEQTSGPEVALTYVSTTGVYHQGGGAWVDENSRARPRRDGGRAHLAAESRLRAVLGERPWTILRLAGIYGPGRLPRLDAVRRGEPIASDPDGFLNLIHVADAAAAALACAGGPPKRLYVAADNEPVRRSQFYATIATMIGAPPPVWTDPGQVQSRSDSNKRVWNRAVRRDLLPKMQFPTFREGLGSLL